MDRIQGAEAFLEILNANGVENIFFNPGGDICPVQAAALKFRAEGKPAPRLVMCLHESVAMTAALGHYMVSGQAQVVMVHSELGTQQVAGALHNAQWGRVPVLLMAGLAAAPRRVNWKNEPYDQGAMARNCVKWDHEFGPGEDIYEVMQKAFDVALGEPRGPVYLVYNRDVFAGMVERKAPDLYRHNPPPLPPADRAGLARIADSLLSARSPLIVAGSNGRYPETIKSLTELAETAGAAVIPGLTRMNFPTTHPLCAGMEEMGGGSRGNLPLTEADVVLAIDYDLPYVPAEGMPGKEATILQIDVDPLTQGRPLWGRGASIFVRADSREAIPALTAVLRSKTNATKWAEISERVDRLREKHRREREDRRAMARAKSEQTPVSPDWVCYCLNQVLGEQDILVNHLISQSSSVAAQIDRSVPNTLLACAGGSINWALGAAIGAKMAAPGKMVVSLMTDGGFVWGCPVAALWSASHHGAPFLSVIFNNQSYGAIRAIVEQMSESRLSDELGDYAGVDISPPPDYAMVARACGGYGRKVEDPQGVMPALREGLEVVKAGKIAVLDIVLPKGVSRNP